MVAELFDEVFGTAARSPFYEISWSRAGDGMHMNKAVFRVPCPKNAALLDHAILDLWLGASGVLDRLAGKGLAPAAPDRRAFVARPGERPPRNCSGRAGNENLACAAVADDVPEAWAARFFGGPRAFLGPEKNLAGQCCRECY